MPLQAQTAHSKRAEAIRRRVETFLFQQDGHLLAGKTEHGLSFPGGGCEEGESGAASARREIEEETGMRSSVVRLPFQGRVLEREEVPQQAPLPSLASSDAPRSDKSQTTYYLGRLLGTRVSSIGSEGDGVSLVSIHPTSMIAKLEQRANDASNPFRAHDAERLEALKKALSILGRGKASTAKKDVDPAVSSLSNARKREGRELRSLFPQTASKQSADHEERKMKTADVNQVLQTVLGLSAGRLAGGGIGSAIAKTDRGRRIGRGLGALAGAGAGYATSAPADENEPVTHQVGRGVGSLLGLLAAGEATHHLTKNKMLSWGRSNLKALNKPLPKITQSEMIQAGATPFGLSEALPATAALAGQYAGDRAARRAVRGDEEKKAHVAQGDEMHDFFGSIRQMRTEVERDRFAKHAASFFKRPEVLGATLGAALGGASATREDEIRAEEVAKRLIGGGLLGGGTAHLGRLAQLVGRGVQSQTKVDPFMRVLHAASTHLPAPLALGGLLGSLSGSLSGYVKAAY